MGLSLCLSVRPCVTLINIFCMGNLTLSRGTMDFLISVLKKYKCWKNPTLIIFSNIFELFLLRVGGWVGIRRGVRNF